MSLCAYSGLIPAEATDGNGIATCPGCRRFVATEPLDRAAPNGARVIGEHRGLVTVVIKAVA